MIVENKKYDRFEETTKYWKEIANTDYNNPSGYYSDSDIHDYQKTYIDKLSNIYTENDSFSLHEIGCNAGRQIRIIESVFKSAEISANDINEKALEIARKHFSANFACENTVEVIKNKFNKITFESDKKWDVLLSCAHLEHLPPNVVSSLCKLIPKVCNNFYAWEIYSSGDQSKEIMPTRRKVDKNWGIWEHSYVSYLGQPEFIEKQGKDYYNFFWNF